MPPNQWSFFLLLVQYIFLKQISLTRLKNSSSVLKKDWIFKQFEELSNEFIEFYLYVDIV